QSLDQACCMDLPRLCLHFLVLLAIVTAEELDQETANLIGRVINLVLVAQFRAQLANADGRLYLLGNRGFRNDPILTHDAQQTEGGHALDGRHLFLRGGGGWKACQAQGGDGFATHVAEGSQFALASGQLLGPARKVVEENTHAARFAVLVRESTRVIRSTDQEKLLD